MTTCWADASSKRTLTARARCRLVRLLNVQDWDEPGGYDAVYCRYCRYCRFLLQHLSQPMDLLRRMWAGVRPCGVLIVEDADFDGCCCHPPNEGFDFFVRTYRRVLQRRGGDHALGRKVYGCFLAAGIPSPQVALVQPVWTEGEGKTLAGQRSTRPARRSYRSA